MLNCGCQAKFHFDCISKWIQTPVKEQGFDLVKCPKCGDKFRIRWVGADGKSEVMESESGEGEGTSQVVMEGGSVVGDDIDEITWEDDLLSMGNSGFSDFM